MSLFLADHSRHFPSFSILLLLGLYPCPKLKNVDKTHFFLQQGSMLRCIHLDSLFSLFIGFFMCSLISYDIISFFCDLDSSLSFFSFVRVTYIYIDVFSINKRVDINRISLHIKSISNSAFEHHSNILPWKETDVEVIKFV